MRIHFAFLSLLLATPPAWTAKGQAPAGGPADGGRAPVSPPARAEGFRVTFLVNDSMVKNKLLPGVGIGVARRDATGTDTLFTDKTGSQGQLQSMLPPGDYLVTYRKRGYVPIERSPVSVDHDGQVITTTMTMMLEAAGQTGRRRVQFVLNWGNDHHRHVADVDAHLAFAWGDTQHEIYFGQMTAVEGGSQAELDVDDVAYGGPETITLLDPPPGDYTYWAYDYSGGSEHLGDSEIAVRVLVGDALSEEFRIPVDVDQRYWRPFRALRIDDLEEARIEHWTPEELAAGEDRRAPPVSLGVGESVSCGSCEDTLPMLILPLILLFGLIQVLRNMAAARRKT